MKQRTAKALSLLLLVASLGGCTASQDTYVKDAEASRPPPPDLSGDRLVDLLNQDCKVWSRSPHTEHSFRWTGRCSDGLAQGTGTLSYTEEGESNTYEGGLLDGRWHGPGTFRTPGAEMRASWRQGRLHGQMYVIHHNLGGSQAAIEYQNGVQHGQYLFSNPPSHSSGVKFVEGQFRNGKKVGRWNAAMWSGRHSTGTYDANGRQVADSIDGKKIGTDFGDALLQGFESFVDAAFDVAVALSQGGQAYAQSNAYRQGEALRQSEAAASQRVLDSICVVNCPDSSSNDASSPTPPNATTSSRLEGSGTLNITPPKLGSSPDSANTYCVIYSHSPRGWKNNCSEGIEMSWNDSDTCSSIPNSFYRCSAYIAPNSFYRTPNIVGRYQHIACYSPRPGTVTPEETDNRGNWRCHDSRNPPPPLS